MFTIYNQIFRKFSFGELRAVFMGAERADPQPEAAEKADAPEAVGDKAAMEVSLQVYNTMTTLAQTQLQQASSSDQPHVKALGEAYQGKFNKIWEGLNPEAASPEIMVFATAVAAITALLAEFARDREALDSGPSKMLEDDLKKFPGCTALQTLVDGKRAELQSILIDSSRSEQASKLKVLADSYAKKRETILKPYLQEIAEKHEISKLLKADDRANPSLHLIPPPLRVVITNYKELVDRAVATAMQKGDGYLQTKLSQILEGYISEKQKLYPNSEPEKDGNNSEEATEKETEAEKLNKAKASFEKRYTQAANLLGGLQKVFAGLEKYQQQLDALLYKTTPAYQTHNHRQHTSENYSLFQNQVEQILAQATKEKSLPPRDLVGFVDTIASGFDKSLQDDSENPPLQMLVESTRSNLIDLKRKVPQSLSVLTFKDKLGELLAKYNKAKAAALPAASSPPTASTSTESAAAPASAPATTSAATPSARPAAAPTAPPAAPASASEPAAAPASPPTTPTITLEAPAPITQEPDLKDILDQPDKLTKRINDLITRLKPLVEFKGNLDTEQKAELYTNILEQLQANDGMLPAKKALIYARILDQVATDFSQTSYTEYFDLTNDMSQENLDQAFLIKGKLDHWALNWDTEQPPGEPNLQTKYARSIARYEAKATSLAGIELRVAGKEPHLRAPGGIQMEELGKGETVQIISGMDLHFVESADSGRVVPFVAVETSSGKKGYVALNLLRKGASGGKKGGAEKRKGKEEGEDKAPEIAQTPEQAQKGFERFLSVNINTVINKLRTAAGSSRSADSTAEFVFYQDYIDAMHAFQSLRAVGATKKHVDSLYASDNKPSPTFAIQIDGDANKIQLSFDQSGNITPTLSTPADLGRLNASNPRPGIGANYTECLEALTAKKMSHDVVKLTAEVKEMGVDTSVAEGPRDTSATPEQRKSNLDELNKQRTQIATDVDNMSRTVQSYIDDHKPFSLELHQGMSLVLSKHLDQLRRIEGECDKYGLGTFKTSILLLRAKIKRLEGVVKVLAIRERLRVVTAQELAEQVGPGVVLHNLKPEDSPFEKAKDVILFKFFRHLKLPGVAKSDLVMPDIGLSYAFSHDKRSATVTLDAKKRLAYAEAFLKANRDKFNTPLSM